jgi:hypothetical protein
MADEYWALGDNPVLWDTATLGSSLTGITFSIGSSQDTYSKFTQFTSGGTIYLRADSDNNTRRTIGSKPATGVFSYEKQYGRVITIHSIESGSTAYEWIKSATGGKGVKYDFMQDLASLNLTNYQKLSTGSDSTTKITAKANGYAPNSNTATWRKGS